MHPDKPWKNIAELAAYLRTKGDKASYAVSATSGVVMCALYKQAADLKSVEVNFRMAQDSLNDLASGAIETRFAKQGVDARHKAGHDALGRFDPS